MVVTINGTRVKCALRVLDVLAARYAVSMSVDDTPLEANPADDVCRFDIAPIAGELVMGRHAVRLVLKPDCVLVTEVARPYVQYKTEFISLW